MTKFKFVSVRSTNCSLEIITTVSVTHIGQQLCSGNSLDTAVLNCVSKMQ